MNIPTCVWVVLLLTLITYCVFNKRVSAFLGNKRECNPLDGRCYKIVGNYDKDSHIAASKKLAELNRIAIELIRYMRKKYLWEPNRDSYGKQLTLNLMENYNPDSVIENAPPDTVNTSYVEDKGIVFAMCLRERKSGKFKIHSDNILVFVLLHELTHLASKEFGHGDVFWHDFSIIIQNAAEAGLYTPVDYSKNPINYCGLDVNYNPYYDKNI